MNQSRSEISLTNRWTISIILKPIDWDWVGGQTVLWKIVSDERLEIVIGVEVPEEFYPDCLEN